MSKDKNERPELNESLPLDQRVEHWLKTTGFPLEFRVGETLVSKGFDISQGVYLPGDDEKNGLEVDVLASLKFEVAEFQLLVECKVIPKHSVWVALKESEHFASEFPNPNAGIGRTDSVVHLEKVHADLFRNVEAPKWPEAPALALRTMLVDPDASQQKEREKDKAFFAVQGLATRTGTLLGQRNAKVGWGQTPTHTSIVVPVLVVDGDLAEATWDLMGRAFKAKATDLVWVAWRGHVQWPLPFFAVPVVKIDALPKFAGMLCDWASRWCEAIDLAHQAAVVASKQAAEQKASEKKQAVRTGFLGNRDREKWLKPRR